MLAFIEFVPQEKCLECCTTMAALQSCHIHPTVLTLHQQIIIYFFHLKKNPARAPLCQ
jgi:hypothetical protein